MTSQICYKGNLRTEATHLKSGSLIETDAPTDNHGKGEKFSPSDLVATSLGSCMLTVMGIKARDMNINIDNTIVDVTKIMSSDVPRRIAGIVVKFRFPETLQLDEKSKQILQNTAKTCPVHKSLHPDIRVEIDFNR